MISIQSQSVAQDIYPIFEVDPAPDGPGPIAINFRGTGFLVSRNLFMTCWHCVDPPAAEGHHLALVGSTELGRLRAAPLLEISRDLDGFDLATARIRADPRLPFTLEETIAEFGTDVATFGYPLTDTPTEMRPTFRVNGRYLRGYITRDFNYDGLEGGEVRSYEVDMRAPEGLSGAPLVARGTRRLVGVIYGQNEVGTIDRFVSVDSEGKRIPEVQQVESFALAHHTSTVLKHRSEATDGVALEELLRGSS